MATKQSTVDYLLDQLSELPNVTTRKMFGEFAVYVGGKVTALVCDNQLFLKPTEAGRARIQNLKEAPAYPGAKPSFLIETDLWEDRDWLTELVLATAAQLPEPKPKKPRK